MFWSSVAFTSCRMYTLRLKKPETFCFPVTRKVQILEMNEDANFTYRTYKMFSKKKYLFDMKYDVKTSKMTFLVNRSRKCMSKRIF